MQLYPLVTWCPPIIGVQSLQTLDMPWSYFQRRETLDSDLYDFVFIRRVHSPSTTTSSRWLRTRTANLTTPRSGLDVGFFSVTSISRWIVSPNFTAPL